MTEPNGPPRDVEQAAEHALRPGARDQPAAARPEISSIVLANDVRGRAGDQLSVEVARAFGAAFADHLDSPELIVAHDMRLSSPELSRAVVEGAVRRGAIVADAGLASTDQLYCASGLHRAAGVMITASHNPPGDNGLKLCLPGARPIGRDTGLDRIGVIAQAYLDAGEIPLRGEGRAEEIDTLADYARTLQDLAPVPAGRPLRVVVDAGSGMAGHTAPAVLGPLSQIDLIALHFTLDGSFPHHPADPLRPENLRDLHEAVLREGADLGLAFDGDADRCVVLDETGTPVPPSALTALIAEREIAAARAAGEDRPVVVANLVTSRHVAEAIHEAGGEHVRTPVGHSLIKAIMAERGAVFGGEHSAHYYFRDFFHADSGMLAALHVLAALREGDGPASALFARHSPYVASGEINSRVEDAALARERVREHFTGAPGVRIDELDGLSVEHWDEQLPREERWWFTLRSSATEPLLRLNVEAEEPVTMERVRDEVLALAREGRTDHPDGSGSTAMDEPTPTPASVTTTDEAGSAAATIPDGAAPASATSADDAAPVPAAGTTADVAAPAADTSVAVTTTAGDLADARTEPDLMEPDPMEHDHHATEPTAAAAPTGAGTDGDAVPTAAGTSGAGVPAWVRAILRCPDCGGELHDAERAMRCAACGRLHPVEGGIPVLIAGRTEPPTAT